MKKRSLFVIALCLVIAYFLFYPTPIDPDTWTAPPAPTMTGPYATNTKLQKTKVFTHQCFHCEDVAVDSMGRIYGAAEDGKILRFDNPEASAFVFANTGGRPLGMVFDAQQNLIVADAVKGLLSINSSGEITTLTSGYNGNSFGTTNDLEIGEKGMIYFTDASRKFPLTTYKLDLLEHRPNGAFYSYEPNTRRTHLILDSLYFANGVAISPDQDFALVVETGKFWVKKVWLHGPKKGKWEFFINNLPGFPDGISSGTDGIFWLALVSPRNPMLDGVMDKPFLRKIIARLPDVLQPKPEKYTTILGLDQNGKVIYNLQDPEGHYSQIANVREFKRKLYFGSLGETTLAVIDRPEL